MKTFKTLLLFGGLLFFVGCQDNTFNSQAEDENFFVDEHTSISALTESGKLENYYPTEKLVGKDSQENSSSSNSGITRSTLTFFDNSADFLSTCPDLATEDFNEVPITLFGCYSPAPDPLDETADDFIFNPGDIAPGISFSIVNNKEQDLDPQLAVITESGCYQGLGDVNALIANYSIDFLKVNLDPGVTAFGADYFTYGTGSMLIEYFGANGPLGSYILDNDFNEYLYLGVHSEEPITEIIISSINDPFRDRAEGIDNISFGMCSLDADGDGCPDNVDPHPNSNTDPTIVINGCDTGVPNIGLNDGCSTMSDLIADAAAANPDYKDFKKAVKDLAKAWKEAGLITGQQRGDIVQCL